MSGKPVSDQEREKDRKSEENLICSVLLKVEEKNELHRLFLNASVHSAVFFLEGQIGPWHCALFTLAHSTSTYFIHPE